MTLALFRKGSNAAALLAVLLLAGAGSAQSAGGRAAERGRQEQAQKAAEAANPDPAAGFYEATKAAPKALLAGNFDQAEKLAADLLNDADRWKDNWNYGNAIHVGNLVLGHVALKRNKVDDAKEFLLKAARTPGSAQLHSFGPNMLLAKELLAKGERQVVIQYLELSREFWPRPKIDEWKSAIEKGNVPEFGANLKYGF